MTLRRYRARRDFEATPEPSGSKGATRSAAKRSYVVQRHAARRLHFDLRLELDGTLKSWAVTKEPGREAGERRLAMHVEDHPLEYARFEGEIPKGHYGAGQVVVWDRGHWVPEGDPRRGYAAGRLSFTLDGERLAGRWSLVRMRAQDGEKGDPWLLIRRSGGPRRTSPTLPATIAFELATPVAAPPEGDDWLHELKLDGYRLACRIDHGKVRLLTRNGHDWTHRFASIRRAAERIPVERAWLDGEAVVLDASGLSHFGALQAALAEGSAPIAFVAFDCLWLDDRDLRDEPLESRKATLRGVLSGAQGGIRALDHLVGRGEDFFAEACRVGAEGVVSKRRDAPHEPRRTRSWLKIRCAKRQEFVVGGYTPEAGHRTGLGALLLGTYDAGKRLAYAGRVGSGFTAEMRRLLVARLHARRVPMSPFVPDVPRSEAQDARWVRPDLVVEVRFKEWTGKDRLRQAAFLGLREDKEAREVTRDPIGPGVGEARRTPAKPGTGRRRAGAPTPRRAGSAPQVAGVPISHPDRVIDARSGLTKLDLARYYASMWSHVEPHLRDRALSVVRCPEGADGDCFFQKHGFVHRVPGVRPVETDGHPGLLVESCEGLVGLVQNGVIELHAPAARLDAPRAPDRIVLDLDPDPALPSATVRDEALRLHRILDDLGLESFVKTTGGKGLHVVVPLSGGRPAPDFASVKAFTHALGRVLLAQPGSLIVLSMSKAQRTGRIYFDDVRNRPGATAVLPWSVRARPGLPVAFPMTWAQLRRARPPFSPGAETALRRLARLRAEPWPDLDAIRQSLPRASAPPKRKR